MHAYDNHVAHCKAAKQNVAQTATSEQLHHEKHRRIYSENPARAAMFSHRGISTNI